MSLKKVWKTRYAECEALQCKFARKANYKKCERLIKVEYLNTSQEVVVLDNHQEHKHEINSDYTSGKGIKYLWTVEQEEIILLLINAKASATVILRQLRERNAPDAKGNFPNLCQINTKKNYMYKTKVMKKLVMLDTADLQMEIDKMLEEPEDPHEAFIVAYNIDNSDVVSGKPRFTITFSTMHLLTRINKFFIQDDATYKMVWQGYPVFTHGVSTATGRFFLTHITLSTHEDTPAFESNFRLVFRVMKGEVPRFRMADGAWEITNAGRRVFGDAGKRLMCWAHVYRNIRPKLAGVRVTNKVLGASILADIESIQWTAQSEEEFVVLCQKLQSHYLKMKLSPRENKPVKQFLDYFMAQWGPNSHVMNWFAGSHPFNLTNNQGIEGTHKELKKNHTFREELPVGQFFQVVGRVVSVTTASKHKFAKNIKLNHM